MLTYCRSQTAGTSQPTCASLHLHMCIQRPLTSGIPPVLYKGRWIRGSGSFRALTVTSPSDGLERTCYLVFYLVDYIEHGATKSSLMCVGEETLKVIYLTFSYNKFSDFFSPPHQELIM